MPVCRWSHQASDAIDRVLKALREPTLGPMGSGNLRCPHPAVSRWGLGRGTGEEGGEVNGQVEFRDDGSAVIFAPNGDPILKLGESGTLLHSFGSHVLDSKAAKLDLDALLALREWSDAALTEARK